MAPAERVVALLRRHHGGEAAARAGERGPAPAARADDETAEIEESGRRAESPIVRLVDSLILGAIERRASDIHIETKDREVLAKYRIDGVLYPALEPLDKRHHDTIISRLKVMSELDIAEKRVPQDGRFRLRVRGRTIDFRVSIMPSIHGEDAVIRILDKEQLQRRLPQPAPRRARLLGGRTCASCASTSPSPTAWCWSPARPAAARPRRSTRRSARSRAPRTRSSRSRTRSSTRSRASCRCRSTRRRA